MYVYENPVVNIMHACKFWPTKCACIDEEKKSRVFKLQKVYHSILMIISTSS